MMDALLKDYLRCPEKELFSKIECALKEKYSTVHSKEGDYIYAEGELPIMLVAHLDTVWGDNKDKFILYDQEQEVLYSPQGICGDDRAGVFAIMKLLKVGFRPSVLFTCGEERYGIGAAQFIMDYPVLPNVNFIIELDRQGTKDAVYYRCANPQFEKFINLFGFETAEGIFSDISIICPAVGIAGVNLSIGYFNEHTPCEMLFINAMYSTIYKVMDIFDLEYLPKFEYIEREENNNG